MNEKQSICMLAWNLNLWIDPFLTQNEVKTNNVRYNVLDFFYILWPPLHQIWISKQNLHIVHIVNCVIVIVKYLCFALNVSFNQDVPIKVINIFLYLSFCACWARVNNKVSSSRVPVHTLSQLYSCLKSFNLYIW